MKELQIENNLTYLFIAHDLSMVKYISDRIGVMHYGKLLEIAPADEIYTHPLHDYTASLISAVPVPDPEFERNRVQVVYDASIEADGKKRRMVEISPEHFVLASEDEVEMYKKRAEKAQMQEVPR